MNVCLIAGLLLQLSPAAATATSPRLGRMTVFSTSEEDPANPNDELACTHKRLKETDKVVASYHLPCGTKVLLVNPKNGRTAVGVVADRGPVRTKKNPSLLRTDLDLSKALARELRFDGDGEMLWMPLP